MIDNIRYIERMVSENFGDSFNDLENTNYWELLKILNAKQSKNSSQLHSNNNTHNAYEYLTHHAI